MVSEASRKAIDEKVQQLRKVKEGTLTPQQLADLITDRRINWIKENFEAMVTKYGSLPPEEQAYMIVYFDHMKINPDDLRMTRISPKKIMIQSYGFCPYLTACQVLELDTRCICREIGEPSIQRMIEVIHPDLRFSRDYDNIRPHKGCCLEYIELL